MAKKIITFISYRPGDVRLTAPPPEYAYSLPDNASDSGQAVSGRHTNDAPLRYYLSRYAFNRGDEVLCLCTPEADSKRIPWIEQFMSQAGADRWPGTNFNYVRASTEQFCRGNGLFCPDFTKIEIASQELDLELALSKIMERVDPGDVVFIDATGGPRDINFVMILLLQALYFKNCAVQDMIYAFFDSMDQGKNAIRRLDAVPRIIHTINAMAEFETYGSTRLFQRLSIESIGVGAQALLAEISGFSQALATSSFSEGELALKAQEKVNRITKEISVCMRPDSDVRPLMRQMLPFFQEKLEFFQKGTVSLSSIVSWCADHYLLQQSATIFNENLKPYLINCHILSESDSLSGFSKDFLERFTSLSKAIPPLPRFASKNMIEVSDTAKAGDGTISLELLHAAESFMTALSRGGQWKRSGEWNPHLSDQALWKRRAVLLLVSCLLKPGGGMRTKAGAMNFALANMRSPELIPFICDCYDGIAAACGDSIAPGILISHLHQENENYRTYYDNILHEQVLDYYGFHEIAADVFKNFQREDGACYTLSHIGCLFLHYQMVRNLRNLLNHADFGNASVAAPRDGTLTELLKIKSKSKKTSLIENAFLKQDPSAIQICLKNAADCLRRLERQIDADAVRRTMPSARASCPAQ